MSLDSVTDVVAEHRHALHLRHIFLQRTTFNGQRAVACCPSLAINHCIRIDGAHLCRHAVHRFYVVDCHQVEAESVDMIFLCPILYRVHDIVAHLTAVGCRLVAAS